MTNDCKTCPVSTGTHKPAEALHQIDEPLAEALLELAAYRFTVENREARIAELEGQLEAIGAGGVEPLRKPAAQAVHPENIREGAPYDNPEFEQLARDMGVWGTAQSAVCAQFWLAATQPAAQGMEADLTDEQIDEAFNQMPDGAAGFLKSWGYRQFARAVLAAQAKQGGAA